MEQHPVPQNVTTFQFRLIGDMTIKQFGYLAGGAILAYISYKLPIPFFFSWPLTFIFALGGVGFAFVPIEERPMDIWVMSFIKNVYSPTLFVWSHQDRTPAAPPQVAKPLQVKPTTDVLRQIFSPPKPVPAVPVASIPTPSITGRHLDISIPPQVATSLPMASAPVAHARTLELQKQLTEVLAERDRMRGEMATLRSQSQKPTSANASHVATVASPPYVPAKTGPTVKIITPEGAIKAGLPRLTTFPNVVTGIIRDSDNNLLPGVLITVRDKDGVPVRALKTNRLGQFAASTPIANGTYLVEIEDPRGRFVFDRAQMTLNGSVVPALEIIAKSQKQVSREKLAKEIFGS